jgi:hypothetical protein
LEKKGILKRDEIIEVIKELRRASFRDAYSA